MFGKKILSVISLLFLSVSVKATDLAACSASCASTYNGNDADELCIDNNMLYEAYSGASHCIKNTTPVKTITGSELVVINDGVSIVDLTDPATDLSSFTAADLSLYQCSEGSSAATCTETVGYIFDNNGTPHYCKIGSGPSCSTVSSLTDVATAGVLNSNGALYVTEKVAKGNGKAYLFTADASSVFGENTIIVKATTNAFAKVVTAATTNYLVDESKTLKVVDNDLQDVNNDSLNESDYCYDGVTASLTSRKTSYCSPANGCDKYYTFNYEDSGVWTDTTIEFGKRAGTCNTITGEGDCSGKAGKYYYLGTDGSKDRTTLGSALQSTVGAEGKLYECVVDGQGSSVCTNQSKFAGYFENAAATGAEGEIKYIQCVINDAANTCKGLRDAPAHTANTCVGNSGAIILKGGKYIQCNLEEEGSTIVDAEYAIAITTCSTNGELIKEGGSTYKICVKKEDNSLAAVPFPVSGSKKYFVSTGNVSAFNDAVLNDHFVAVEINAKTAIVDRENNPKKYLYANKSTREIINKGADPTNMCDNGSLKTSYGHEFEMTIPYSDSDNVNVYKENDA